MSASPAEPLRLLLLWRAIGAVLVAAVVWFSVAPQPPEIPVEDGDKLGHLLGYGALALWFGQILAGRTRIAGAAGLVLLGCALEGVQALLPWRSFELADMAANAAGVALGTLAALPLGQRMLAALERLAGPQSTH